MAIKTYIVNLPDYVEGNAKTGNLLFNGVETHPIPYEESIGRYKETLEFLKVATKDDLMRVYGVSSLESLFCSKSVEEIVGKFETEISKYKRVLELLDDIELFELYSIVNDLYTAKLDEIQRFKDIIRTLKGKCKSESN